MSTQEQNTPLPHDLQIQLDVYLYGNAYERLLPDGTIERIDPTTIRAIRSNEKESMMKPIPPDIQAVINRRFWDMIDDNSESKHP